MVIGSAIDTTGIMIQIALALVVQQPYISKGAIHIKSAWSAHYHAVPISWVYLIYGMDYGMD